MVAMDPRLSSVDREEFEAGMDTPGFFRGMTYRQWLALREAEASTNTLARLDVERHQRHLRRIAEREAGTVMGIV